ncbi:FAD/NAD(P)-binding protein [Actinomadura roseirufa]|uniref:FAD/NAD(P)-binding protein n=1 Tax=Actinomadura roseirufa TaxID=2094049 RepID=UPI00104136AA|nr:FAD/NAD(P)-binding protein [Actinomadura roseirufa]
MDITIVGAGAATVALLDTLAHTGGQHGTLTILEASPHFWRGRPYAPDLDTVLVNAPPALMSIHHTDAGHYATWLEAHGGGVMDDLLGHPLVPRALYGEYLEHTAQAALQVLHDNGWSTRILAARATGVTRSGDRLRVLTENGREHHADRVVLCVGGGTPQDHYGLTGAPGFVADPYPLARTLDRIPSGHPVAIIGSGLTAVDVAVSLAAHDHTGPITLVSRSGVLPHVWQRPTGYQPRHLTPERLSALRRAHGTVTLDALTGLLRAELADAGEDFDRFAAETLATATDDPVERLRRQLAAVDDPRIGRRVLQQAAHALGPAAWRSMPEPDRDRLREHFRVATSLASPMVPVNAQTLLRLFDSGRLTTVTGVEKIEASDGTFHIHAATDHRTTTVINAVNPPPRSVPREAAQLVASLVENDLATHHPSGGLLPADPRLHVLGDLSAEGPFITSGIAGLTAASSAVGPGGPSLQRTLRDR